MGSSPMTPISLRRYHDNLPLFFHQHIQRHLGGLPASGPGNGKDPLPPALGAYRVLGGPILCLKSISLYDVVTQKHQPGN